MRRREALWSAIAVVALAGSASNGAAAPSDTADTATILQQTPANPNLFAFNYGADGSPALNLLGLSPSKVQVSTGLTPFALSVPSLFDGSAGQSIGLDIAPAYALQKVWPLWLSDYQSGSPFRRMLIRSHVELAFTNGMAASDATKIQQSALAFTVGTSLLDSSDPAARGGGGRFFAGCLAPVLPTIQSGLATEAEDWQTARSAARQLVNSLGGLVDSRDGKHKDPVFYQRHLTDDGPAIIRAYAVIAPAERVSLPLARAADPPPAPQALAELRDVFAAYAKAHTADSLAAGQALAYAQEVEDLAEATTVGPLPPTSGALTVAAERDDVAAFIASDKTDPKLARTLTRLTATPQFGAPSASGAAEDAGILERQKTYIDQHLTHMFEIASAYEATNAALYTSQRGMDIFARLGVTKAVADCVSATATVTAAAPDLSFGLGFVEDGRPGAVAALHPGGETVWLAGRFPIYTDFARGDFSDLAKGRRDFSDLAKGKGDAVLLGGSVNYTNHASVTTGQSASPIIEANVFSAWLGLQGYSSWLRVGAQGGYTDTRATDGMNAKYSTSGFRWLTSASVKVYNNIWLGGSYGTANGTTAKLDDKTFLLTLSFSTPKTTPAFGPSRAPPSPPAPPAP